MRDEAFAEAYRDGIRAMIGDQEEVDLDVLADGHLWYDKHQGFIGSFALYNGERFEGTRTRMAKGAMEETLSRSSQAAGRDTSEEWNGLMEVFDAINSVQMIDEYYGDRRALLEDLADVYHAELLSAVESGAEIVELDDLIFLAPEDEWEFDVEILNRVFDGIDAYRIWHCCHGGTPAPIGMAPYEAMFPYVKDLQVDSFDWSFAQTGFRDEELKLFATPGFDKDLGLGVISNKNYLIETPTEVADGIRAALRHVEPERIHLTTDCGLYAYARPAARAKLKAMVKGADVMRRELA